jgi:uncharacterized membrane protein YcaP (DUF421 family)
MKALVDRLLILGEPLPEKVIRTLLVYAFLILELRLAGKRQLGQMNPFDLVMLLLLAITVQNAIIGADTSLSGGLVGASVLLLANALVVRFFHRRRDVAQVVEGVPVPLIEEGRLLRDNLDRELITEEALLVICRQQGIERFADVERAILETGGTVSVFRHHPSPEEIIVARLSHRFDAIEGALQALRQEAAHDARIPGGTPAVGEHSPRRGGG